MRLRIALAVGLCLAALAPYGPAQADGGPNASATGTPGPSSDGTGAVTHGRLVAGAGGTYLPITPNDLVPTGPDARSPLDIPPAAPNPQGMTCPAVHVLHLGPGSPGPVGSILEFVAIHPHFTKNSAGGYDGSDPAFGYDVPDAVPAGGDPTATAPGSPATAANIAGHIVSVAAYLHVRGTWVDARQVPPYGGSCQGAQFTFGAPFLEGDAPAPAPPQSVLQTPPFPTGPALVARLSRSWTIGTVETLPGSSSTSRTFVHIPTCAWTRSTVPAAPAPFHALTETLDGGYVVFLLYDVVVTPGPVTWSWGDGLTTTAPGPVEAGPPGVPAYDPSTQRWTDPCAVSHAYESVSTGETITAAERFTIAITVSWSDGVTVHTESVPCDPVTGGACDLSVGADQGWRSGPHPVDQIEPVPFAPTSPTP